MYQTGYHRNQRGNHQDSPTQERRCRMPEEEITDGLMMKYVRWMMRNGKDKEEYTEEEIDAFVDRFMRERMAGG